ncbi:YifB family Mg chelatase-like AAA ATPase [Oceanimonas doudoroffii]|uniref:ATP-dependent protease n=1 Tax=Oceanimonas doudoroffii TaxID=84158 RepID=A0A233RE85_9GAMM|nr:YifB family Mg chelatase-like AAA ATPase [Oceanimonas doudoroffii]OXY81697.1 ATP-dependent protease [Oceanimonas doudoroffii]
MSLAIVFARASLGVTAPLVTVEAHLANGLPAFNIVGLPETTVKEARDRVRSALINAGFEFPARRITINLAPADLPKDGGRFDLPIAMAILAASAQIPASSLDGLEFLGELALTGELRGIKGALPAVLAARDSDRRLIIPAANGAEAGLISPCPALLASHLLAITAWLREQGELLHPEHRPGTEPAVSACLSEVIGQETGKRALEIAAAGEHNLLFLGPPGTGKSMLASRLPGLLPPMTEQEALEAAAIRSISGQPLDAEHWRQRAFRQPHHSSSAAALVGGGSHPKPGEISLAHHGVLFLDELTEFERRVLDALREPLETGTINISRAAHSVCFPARFQLIGAMNPSPCGHYQDGLTRSSPEQILRYLGKISGPFADRFDLSVEVPQLPPGELSRPRQKPEGTAEVRARVLAARQRQLSRAGKSNAHLSAAEMERLCPLSRDDAAFLEQALHHMKLSIRAWHKLIRVARTIADLAGERHIGRPHLTEALSYRAMDRLLVRLRE